MGRWSRVFLTRPIYDATIPDFRQAFVRTDVAALKGLPTPPIIYEAKGIGHFDNKAFPQDADFQSRANVELYEKLVAAEPDELWLVLDLAHKYFDGGDYEGAIRKYKAAIEVDPGFAPAYAYLGRAYFRNYCLGPAAAALRRAVEINPDHARASNFLGVCLRRQALQCHWGEPGHEERGDELLREAVAWHERAIRVSTVEQMRFPWARNALNMTIAESYKRPVQTPYRLPQALLHSRELLEDVDVRAERKEHLVLHTMGVIKLKLKSWDEARAYFRRALGLLEKRQQTDPVSIDAKGFAERKAEILFHWGLCDLGHSGRWDGAQRRWRDAKNAVKQGWGRDWRRVWEEQYWTKRRVSAGQDQSTIDDVVGG
jgi:tetratricopeptide (TPR) repeat protein